MLFFQLLLDPVALEAGQVIDEQLAVEVIALVLDAHGEQAFGDQLVVAAVALLRLDSHLLRAVDILVEAGHRQAAFLVLVHLVGQGFEHRIDEDHRCAAVFAQVHDHDALVHVDLRGRQTNARRFVHGFKHVIDQLTHFVVHNLHDYAHDRRKTTDDYPFGGEAGMVLKCEPVFELVEKLQSERHYDEIIYTSPDGIRYDQHEANRLSTLDNLIILCGHYKGIDYRIREHLVTREISIGDYVLTGGELAACIIADSVIRIIPGAIGDEASALTDCFQDNLLAPPVYTRPAEFNGWKVPDVLLSGNFARIDRWKEEQAWERTKRLRPDLLKEE